MIIESAAWSADKRETGEALPDNNNKITLNLKKGV
jgi:hypothetical protein